MAMVTKFPAPKMNDDYTVDTGYDYGGVDPWGVDPATGVPYTTQLRRQIRATHGDHDDPYGNGPLPDSGMDRWFDAMNNDAWEKAGRPDEGLRGLQQAFKFGRSAPGSTQIRGYR